MARRLRPSNRALWRGGYTLHARPNEADIEFAVSRGCRPGGGSERYRGTIRGAVLRVREGSLAARAKRAVEEYRWVRLGAGTKGAA